MFYTYILKSRITNKYYIGSTNNLTARITRHNKGYNKSTKPGIPWVLVHYELFQTKQEAYKREKQVKNYKGGNAFKKIIANTERCQSGRMGRS